MGTSETDQAELESRLAQLQELVGKIDQSLLQEVAKLGFDAQDVQLQSAHDARYYLELDPANGEYSLKGDWLDKRGMKQGGLVFHADGSFFVEQDVVKKHPKKSSWFVEAVNAWGRDLEIKAEARLLPMPE